MVGSLMPIVQFTNNNDQTYIRLHIKSKPNKLHYDLLQYMIFPSKYGNLTIMVNLWKIWKEITKKKHLGKRTKKYNNMKLE